MDQPPHGPVLVAKTKRKRILEGLGLAVKYLAWEWPLLSTAHCSRVVMRTYPFSRVPGSIILPLHKKERDANSRNHICPSSHQICRSSLFFLYPRHFDLSLEIQPKSQFQSVHQTQSPASQSDEIFYIRSRCGSELFGNLRLKMTRYLFLTYPIYFGRIKKTETTMSFWFERRGTFGYQ